MKSTDTPTEKEEGRSNSDGLIFDASYLGAATCEMARGEMLLGFQDDDEVNDDEGWMGWNGDEERRWGYAAFTHTIRKC